MTEDQLRESMVTIATRSRPFVAPTDLWNRGMRQRRRRRATTVAALVVIIALVMTLPTLLARDVTRSQPTQPTPAPRAPSDPAVPAIVHRPLPWQPTAQDSPPGPAAMVITGHGPFSGSSRLDGYKDDGLVVGASGLYRTIKYNTGADRQGELLLSPDGRYVAGDSSMQGSSREATWSGRTWTSVLDLTTGTVRSYDIGTPKAWLNERLLVSIDRSVKMVDLVTGATSELFEPPPGGPGVSNVVASSNTMQLIAELGDHSSFYLVNVALRVSSPVTFSSGDWPAAVSNGGWTNWTIGSCIQACGATEKMFRLDVHPASPSNPGPGVDGLIAERVRLLGFERGQSAVVQVFRRSTPSTEILALSPRGGHRTVLTVPDGAADVDIARLLLERGRFGGPAPSARDRISDVASAHRVALSAFLGGLGLAGLLIARWYRRRRRRRGAHGGSSTAWTSGAVDL